MIYFTVTVDLNFRVKMIFLPYETVTDNITIIHNQKSCNSDRNLFWGLPYIKFTDILPVNTSLPVKTHFLFLLEVKDKEYNLQ